MKALLVLVACVLVCSASTTSARETVSIRVSPSISMAPATVRVTVVVEPNADNRELVVEADSGDFFTSSTVQLDGSKSARMQAFMLKELPAGEYEIAARVIRRNGDTQKAGSNYMVLQ